MSWGRDGLSLEKSLLSARAAGSEIQGYTLTNDGSRLDSGRVGAACAWRATEDRARATSQWVRDHVRPSDGTTLRGDQAFAAGCFARSGSRQPSAITSYFRVTLR